MNLNLVNLTPSDWSKADWREAYALYCTANMFGPKTKQEYYNWVLEREKARRMREKPLDAKLACQWVKGCQQAKKWAQARVKGGCDINGRAMADIIAEREHRGVLELSDSVADLEQRVDIIASKFRKKR